MLSLTLALLALLLLPSCSPYRKGDTSTVMTVGNVAISAELYSFVYEKNKDQYFGADADPAVLSASDRALLSDAVENELRNYAAIFIAAERFGVSLSSSDEEEIAALMKEKKEEFEDPDLFYEELENMHMTENVLFGQCRNMALDSKLYEARKPSINADLTPDRLLSDVRSYCYAAVQLLWSGRDAADALKRVEAGIRSVEDFYDAVARYSADNDRGVRVCIVGEMLEPFEKAALALQPGQISGVVESSVGAHIILRVELTDDLIQQNLDDLREKDIVRIYREELRDAAQNAVVTYADGFRP